MSLGRRCRGREWMDEPGLDRRLHVEALEGLGRINRLAGTASLLWRAIREGARASGPLGVLDVGCGGGDIVVSLAKRARAAGVDARIDGCDASPFAVEFARRHAERSGAGGVRFFQHDVLADPLPGPYDVVMCSLVLHHFDEPDAVALLGRLGRAARARVIVQDLERTRAGYLMAWLGCRLLSRSPVVRNDGPLSVAGAFTVDEATGLARRANLADLRVRRCWPERFLMSAGPLS